MTFQLAKTYQPGDEVVALANGEIFTVRKIEIFEPIQVVVFHCITKLGDVLQLTNSDLE